MSRRAVRADGDRLRFAIAALGVGGLVALAFVIRGSSPPPDVTPLLHSHAVEAPLLFSRPAAEPAFVPRTAATALSPERHLPRPASASGLQIAVAARLSTRQMPPLPIVPIELGAGAIDPLPARRLGVETTAPVAFSGAAVAAPPPMTASTAADRGSVASAVVSAGRQVGSSVRTVGRVLQRVF